MTARHVPVLLPEVMDALALAPGMMAVDATFGAGGYTRALIAAGATVTAFDRDPRAIAAGQALVAEAGGHLTLVHAPFSAMAAHLPPASVDALAFDLGVSSMQLDQAAYGMSFRFDGPLDMRMDNDGPTAADFLNTATEAMIADTIYALGEEPASRRIARAIIAARPIATTTDLATAVRRALGNPKGAKRDPATRTFQAIRLYVNDELGELDRGLAAAEALLKPGGRLAVVSFHSLEDRMVKRFLSERSGATPGASRHLPETARAISAPTFERPARAVRPGAAELAANPRARSATLRAARRTAAPAWSLAA